MEEIKAITMPGIHSKFLDFLNTEPIPEKAKILDIGAGQGAFSKQLYEQGYDVSPCDLFPEYFYYHKLECKKVDVTKSFPYPDSSFDAAIAIEVSEHIFDHDIFFREINRILKPNGKLYLSTPNILSLKSRFKYLFSGFFYSFDPLEMDNYNGLQHIASRTINQYNYIAQKNGFSEAEIEIDKKQKSSRWLLVFMSIFLWLSNRKKKRQKIHNSHKILLGRLLFMKYTKT